jgi:H+-transporting ATPase
MIASIDGDQGGELSVDEACSRLESGSEGLTAKEARLRLARFGCNALGEKKVGPLVRFPGYFRGPVLWVIEIAAALSAVARRRGDFAIILALLVFNAVVGHALHSHGDTPAGHRGGHA